MNTNLIAKEYRLSHWAGVLRDRQESGLSVRAYCEREGFHENIYFYWQRKLREAACTELSRIKADPTPQAPTFAEIKLAESHPQLPPTVTSHNQVCMESGGIRITAGSEYPADKLAVLLQEVIQSC